MTTVQYSILLLHVNRFLQAFPSNTQPLWSIISHEFTYNPTWMVLLAESLASLLYNMVISMHVRRWFLTLYSQMRIGNTFYTLLSSINLSGVTYTFVGTGATSVSLMSGFSSTMFTAYYGPWAYVVAFMVSINFIECIMFSHLDQHQSLSSLTLTNSYDGMLSHPQHTTLCRINNECVYVGRNSVCTFISEHHQDTQSHDPLPPNVYST